MTQKRMIKIILKIQKSRVYRKLEALITFFDQGVFTSKLVRKIRKSFVILKRRISRIIRKMRSLGVDDGQRMDFYRLVRKFMPAFVKAWQVI